MAVTNSDTEIIDLCESDSDNIPPIHTQSLDSQLLATKCSNNDLCPTQVPSTCSVSSSLISTKSRKRKHNNRNHVDCTIPYRNKSVDQVFDDTNVKTPTIVQQTFASNAKIINNENIDVDDDIRNDLAILHAHFPYYNREVLLHLLLDNKSNDNRVQIVIRLLDSDSPQLISEMEDATAKNEITNVSTNFTTALLISLKSESVPGNNSDNCESVSVLLGKNTEESNQDLPKNSRPLSSIPLTDKDLSAKPFFTFNRDDFSTDSDQQIWFLLQLLLEEFKNTDADYLYNRLERVATINKDGLRAEFLKIQAELRVPIDSFVDNVPSTSNAQHRTSIASSEELRRHEQILEFVQQIYCQFPQTEPDAIYNRLSSANDLNECFKKLMSELKPPDLLRHSIIQTPTFALQDVIMSLAPDNANQEEFKLTDLTTDSPDYDDVRDLVERTRNNFRITISNIFKITNPVLYAHFQLRRAQVVKELTGNAIAADRLLFHGTHPSYTKTIASEGFNRSMAGHNGINFGHGCYFAQDFAYSIKFAHPDAQGRRYIFCARVITGEFCAGNPQMKVLPLRPNSNRRYHSAVDYIQGPTMFVVFHDGSAFPAYLIVFKI